MFFRSYGHGHRRRYQPCTSARVSVGFPFPWVLRMIPPTHTNRWKSSQAHDEQQISTKVVFVYPLMQGNALWICTVLSLLASHVQSLLYRTGIIHNLSYTWNHLHHVWNASQIVLRYSIKSGKYSKIFFQHHSLINSAEIICVFHPKLSIQQTNYMYNEHVSLFIFWSKFMTRNVS